MKNNEKYRKVFDRFYDSAVDDEKILTIITRKDKTPMIAIRKWALVAAAFIVIFSGTTLVAAAAGWIDLSDIFRKGFDDQTSADLIESGIVQELEIVNETDDFTLKLVAFTGDTETQKVLFELTPKKDLVEFNEIRLMVQTFCPCVLVEEESYSNYAINETTGYELRYDEDKNTYYISYRLPPYWIRDLNEDVILRITGVKLYDGGLLTKYMNCNLIYQFTPDRTILEQPVTIEVNQQIAKDVFKEVGFTDDYRDSFTASDAIVAPRTWRTMQIVDVVISQYKTEVNGIIMEEEITDQEARSIWNQFTEPRFVTEHYWNGIEQRNCYNIVAVDNEERIRLFVDDAEIKVDEESLSLLPGKGHENGNSKTDGLYGCAISFDGVDYDKAKKIEIHFGDQIITIK